MPLLGRHNWRYSKHIILGQFSDVLEYVSVNKNNIDTFPAQVSTFQAWLHSIHDLHSHTRQDTILHPRWIGGHTIQRLYCNSQVQFYHITLQNLLANFVVIHLFSDGLEWPHKKYQTSVSENSFSQKVLHTVSSKPKFHIISASSTLEVSLVLVLTFGRYTSSTAIFFAAQRTRAKCIVLYGIPMTSRNLAVYRYRYDWICLPSLLVDQLPLNKRDSDGFFSSRLAIVLTTRLTHH